MPRLRALADRFAQTWFLLELLRGLRLTARYLFRHLAEAGIAGLAQVDSATKGNRADILQLEPAGVGCSGVGELQLGQESRDLVRERGQG